MNTNQLAQLLREAAELLRYAEFTSAVHTGAAIDRAARLDIAAASLEAQEPATYVAINDKGAHCGFSKSEKGLEFRFRGIDAVSIVPLYRHPPTSAVPLADDSRKLSDIGNELHNLSCEVNPTSERWAEQISVLAGELWRWDTTSAVPKCKKCGDKLNHDDDGLEVCRWCDSGFKRSNELDCAPAAAPQQGGGEDE